MHLLTGREKDFYIDQKSEYPQYRLSEEIDTAYEQEMSCRQLEEEIDAEVERQNEIHAMDIDGDTILNSTSIEQSFTVADTSANQSLNRSGLVRISTPMNDIGVQTEIHMPNCPPMRKNKRMCEDSAVEACA